MDYQQLLKDVGYHEMTVYEQLQFHKDLSAYQRLAQEKRDLHFTMRRTSTIELSDYALAVLARYNSRHY